MRTVLSLNAVQPMINKFVEATDEAYHGAVGQAHLLGFAYGSQMATMILSYVPVVLYGSYLLYDNVRKTGCDPSGSVSSVFPDADTCDPSGRDIFGALMGISVSASVLLQISVAIEKFSGQLACFCVKRIQIGL
mgnify:CR=1 FL=1